MNKILQIENLSKTYPGGIQALKNVSFEVATGEFIILLGLSGSGKSTLLRCINRLIEPTAGNVVFEKQNITNCTPHEMRKYRVKIGMIFQQFNLVRNLSAETNVLTGKLGYMPFLPSIFLSSNKPYIKEANHALQRVGLMEFKKHKVKFLSGGQQQRVAIARALMQQPSLILADEPVASLDPATADTVMRYLGELNRNDKITVICSLHFLSLARKYGSRVLALKDGQIVFDGKPDEITNERFKQIYGQDAEEVEIR